MNIWPWESRHNCSEHGHLFEARYDQEPGTMNFNGEMSNQSAKEYFKARTKKTYVHDICVYCGTVVNRPEDGKKS